MAESRLRRWQGITIATLLVGYTGYYICRSNFSVSVPLLEAEGYSKTSLGWISTLGVWLYALGKITNGILADYLGGRLLFILGMVASAACTAAFGLSSSLTVFGLLWCINRYVQSMGWVALVKVSSRWFPVGFHATIMGILSTSYLAGDALARLYLGSLIELGSGWRGVFFAASATLGGIAFVSLFTLRSSPQSIGEREPLANPGNVYGEKGNEPEAHSFVELLMPLLRNPIFWLVCAMNIGLTLIRESFNFWGSTFLKEGVGMSTGQAAIKSLAFPLTGAVASVLGGLLCDRLKGRYGWVIVPCLVLLVGVFLLMTTQSVQGMEFLAIALICAVAFFTLMPYTLFSGVMALDLGAKKGSSTASGIIDSVGYFGGSLSGVGVGAIAQHYGWTAVMKSFVGVTAMTLGIALVYLLLHKPSTEKHAA